MKGQRWLVLSLSVLILLILIAWRIFPPLFLEEEQASIPFTSEAAFVTATVASSAEMSPPFPNGAPVSSTPSPLPLVSREVPLLTSKKLNYAPETSWRFPDDPHIEGMRGNIIHTFQRCQLEFANTRGELVSGFMPGAEYPMIFVRDTATMMATLPYLYGNERLRTPIEEFLRRQYGPQTVSDEDGYAAGEGAISAVVAPDHHIDKATAVSDEETSLIHAAYIYYQVVGGQGWLRNEINGRSIIARLNGALDWLYAHRYDQAYGLIVRGHTTDWGDVKMEPTTANPTDIDPASDHWTCSIYDQALTYRALLELAEMNEALGDGARAELLRGRAASLRSQTNRHLWQPKRGFYRTHLHLTPLRHSFDEAKMVSIANAVAVYCGLTEEDQTASIFRNLEEARLAAGAGKPGLVLYPPYPRGTFAHMQMGEGQYQNGGLWDWWGGVQITAEFASGHAGQALVHLRQVAEDWSRHPTEIYEWQELSRGLGRGPAHYAGAAGTMGQAIIEGLYGVYIRREGMTLQPRLGQHSGYVRVHQPASGLYAAYDYLYLGDTIVMDYGTNHASQLMVKILLPEGNEVGQVKIDGEAVAHSIERVGDDLYCTLPAPAGLHRTTTAL
ncbi:MAG: hypothetical protein ACETWB_05915, partial [Anaerolineae bacterium]